jgi:hypothetical protein
MTLMGKRAEFAQAMSGVPDCNGYAFRPATPNIGDAWSVMGPADAAGGDAFLQTWGIRVILPEDEQAAAEWWDAHWPAIFYALKPVGSVRRTEPVTLPVQGGGDLLAVQITVVAEE